MKTKRLLIAIVLGTMFMSCSSDKSNSNDNSEHQTETSSIIALDDAINGTWVITNIEGDGGISKDIKFVFDNNNLTLDAGYYKDKVKMLSGDKSSMSYKDQNDITWKYNYKINGNTLTLENLFNDKTHATYTLEKE